MFLKVITHRPEYTVTNKHPWCFSMLMQFHIHPCLFACEDGAGTENKNFCISCYRMSKGGWASETQKWLTSAPKEWWDMNRGLWAKTIGSLWRCQLMLGWNILGIHGEPAGDLSRNYSVWRNIYWVRIFFGGHFVLSTSIYSCTNMLLIFLSNLIKYKFIFQI